MGMQNLCGCTHKRWASYQTAVEHGAQGINIGAAVNLTAASTLLWRHIGRCANRATNAG